jgi:hypothetical protein
MSCLPLRPLRCALPALALLASLGTAPVWADEGWRSGPRIGDRYGDGQRQPRIGESRLSGDRTPPDRRGERPAGLRDGSRDGGWQPIPRSAPPRLGDTVYVRPPASYHTVHLGTPYWYYQGAWYSPRGGAYVVVRPPVGLYLSTLPYYQRVVYVGPSVYYVAHDVYYAPVASGGYQVVEPPAGTARAVFDYPIAYPARNQSAQQQADDQFQCHEWAVHLSQFDPTLLGSGQPMNDSPTLRDNYVRAWSACMEGRGYSVR